MLPHTYVDGIFSIFSESGCTFMYVLHLLKKSLINCAKPV